MPEQGLNRVPQIKYSLFIQKYGDMSKSYIISL